MHHFQAVSLNGLIYVLGAFTGEYPGEQPVPNVYIYNPATNAWATGPAIPVARRRGAAGVTVYKIYLAGGIVNGHNGGFVPGSTNLIRLPESGVPCPTPRGPGITSTPP